MRKPELLAPAGDLERCKIAIRYGADAVYIGGKLFSLRSRASNFSIEEIQEACEFAKVYGASIHVTVNMVPHEEDFEGLAEYLKKLEEVGVKAIIVASVSVMDLARKVAPKLEVHCSTQFSSTNLETIQFLQENLGVKRVVLARECSLEEIQTLAKASPIETEVFIHGGMCVNYSGRCTLSNRMTLRDANRGGCAQSCRWFYHLYDQDQEIPLDPLFTMGSKDLCTISILPELIHTGVHSLKIEGRMKTEYYIASIVSLYRALIDEAWEGSLTEERKQIYFEELKKIENRDTCVGFYQGEAFKESIITKPNSNQEVNHSYIGRVVGKEDGFVKVSTRNPFSIGDIVEVLSPNKAPLSFQIDQILDEDKNLIERSYQPMTNVYLSIPFEVQEEDFLRLLKS